MKHWMVFVLLLLGVVSHNVSAQVCGSVDLVDFTNDLEREMITAGLDNALVGGVLQNSRLVFYPNVFKGIKAGRSDTTKPGYNSYDKFLIKKSASRGKRFLTANVSILDAVEKRYGIPRKILTAFKKII